VNLPPAFSYIAWTGLAVSWEGMTFFLKNLAETLEKESPETWEAIGKPKFGYFGGNAGQIAQYLREGKYRDSESKAIAQAGFWARIGNQVFAFCLVLFVLYCIAHFLPNPPSPK
jgi:hypothetical protein